MCNEGDFKKTIYGCVNCKKGFHVNCFTAYHCHGALVGDTKALADMVIAANRMPRAANKTSKHVGDIETLVLPERKENNNNE